MPETQRAESARVLFLRDSFETVHACQRIDVRQAFMLVTTLCGRNVPPNARWPHERSAATCPDCGRITN